MILLQHAAIAIGAVMGTKWSVTITVAAKRDLLCIANLRPGLRSNNALNDTKLIHRWCPVLLWKPNKYALACFKRAKHIFCLPGSVLEVSK